MSNVKLMFNCTEEECMCNENVSGENSPLFKKYNDARLNLLHDVLSAANELHDLGDLMEDEMVVLGLAQDVLEAFLLGVGSNLQLNLTVSD